MTGRGQFANSRLDFHSPGPCRFSLLSPVPDGASG